LQAGLPKIDPGGDRTEDLSSEASRFLTVDGDCSKRGLRNGLKNYIAVGRSSAMLPPLPMSLTPNNFDTATYTDAASPTLQAAAAGSTPPAVLGESFAWGIVGGIAGAIAGAILYVAFIEATHFRIGYLSVAVAFLVAKGMMVASKAKGGFQYQVTAVALTCVAVAVGNAAMLYVAISQKREIVLSLHSILVLLKYGAEDPILRFQTSGARAVIGLVILYVGLRAAWRMTSGNPEAMSHPFTR
jgi:hypothetical protein